MVGLDLRGGAVDGSGQRMITANVDMTGFNRMLFRYLPLVEGGLKEIVRNQSALLIEELVKITPPRNLQKARAKIERSVRKDFIAAGASPSYNLLNEGRSNPGEELWVQSSLRSLSFIDKSNDLRGLSDLKGRSGAIVSSMYGLSWAIKDRGRRLLSVGIRGKQHVYRLNKQMVNRNAFKQYLKDKQARLGRLKAGWITGEGALRRLHIPAWVRKHISDPTVGYYLNWLERKDHAGFEIHNTARGASQSWITRLARLAVSARIAKMTIDIRRKLKWAAEQSRK